MNTDTSYVNVMIDELENPRMRRLSSSESTRLGIPQHAYITPDGDIYISNGGAGYNHGYDHSGLHITNQIFRHPPKRAEKPVIRNTVVWRSGDYSDDPTTDGCGWPIDDGKRTGGVA